MPEHRPAVPVALKRRLFEESGYRCAVPQCRGTSALEMAHIEPWAKIKEHRFENMIVLCAVDHARFDHGEIPLASMLVFKENLAVTKARYSDLENRALTLFAQMDDPRGTQLLVPANSEFIFMNMARDGLATVYSDDPVEYRIEYGTTRPAFIRLTPEGEAFVGRLREGKSVL